ncbi:hypothetical protein VNI00_014851 [Paramarasmius palmivorus]|uniref:Uncharacterized protein n=1 Tax=Paramarasmius palmivorus TaxID=297713 RepID=A0AAW0BQF0_9AGAR
MATSSSSQRVKVTPLQFLPDDSEHGDERPPRWVSPSVKEEWPDYFPDSETSSRHALQSTTISHPEAKEVGHEGAHDQWRQYAAASEQLLKPGPDDHHEHYEGYDVYVRTLDIPGHLDPGLSKRYFVKIMKNNKIVQDFTPPIGVYEQLIPDTPFIPIAGMNVFQLPAHNVYEIKYKEKLLCAFGGTFIRDLEYQSFT